MKGRVGIGAASSGNANDGTTTAAAASYHPSTTSKEETTRRHHRRSRLRQQTTSHNVSSKEPTNLHQQKKNDDDNDNDDNEKNKKRIHYWGTTDILRKRSIILFGLGSIVVLIFVFLLKRWFLPRAGDDLPPNVMLDFLVAGFPKCGTTTLLAALCQHPEIAMDSEENCQIARPIQQDDVNLKRLNRYLDSLRTTFLTNQVSSLRKTTLDSKKVENNDNDNNNKVTDFKLGIKCPESVKNFKAIHRLSQHSPNCKFVIGVRHPILFLQSFYNYRVLEAHLKNRIKEGIPSLSQIWDQNINWYDVSPDATRYELFLAQFGKTNLTVQQMQNMFLDRPMLAVKPNRFRIFLYTMEQLEDPTQSETLRRDLRTFLGLNSEITDFGHENKIWGEESGRIDICHTDFDRIRAIILQQSEETARWMNTFLDSSDVIVSNSPYVRESISHWSIDPCLQTIRG